MKTQHTLRLLSTLTIVAAGLSLAACNDKDTTVNKTTTTKTTDTPEGTKVTTEKVEKKVETETKKP